MSGALLPRALLENLGNVRNSQRSRAGIVQITTRFPVCQRKGTDIA